jgi:hypothetical protein
VTIHQAPTGGKLIAEGYRLRSFDNGGAPGVEIEGNDEHGVLAGIGGRLRALEMRRDSVTVGPTWTSRRRQKYAVRLPSLELSAQDHGEGVRKDVNRNHRGPALVARFCGDCAYRKSHLRPEAGT